MGYCLQSVQPVTALVSPMYLDLEIVFRGFGATSLAGSVKPKDRFLADRKMVVMCLQHRRSLGYGFA